MLSLATKDAKFILQVYQNQSLSKCMVAKHVLLLYHSKDKKIHTLGKKQILTCKSNIGNRQEGADLIKVKKDF